ncbi:MAG: hypothetical protein AB1894_08955 [Chloroflexota bacterium]
MRIKSFSTPFSCTIVSILTLSLLLSACNLPSAATPVKDLSAINTAAAQTIQAETAKQTATAQTPPASTVAPGAPTDTTSPILLPTPSATIESLAPSDTPAPISGNPTITADIETNCRTGPSKDYPRVGYILPGQQAAVVGRNSSNTWWYIENLKKPGEYCWVWGESTVVTGNTSLLPIITPPPLPTPIPVGPSFQAQFWKIRNCGGSPAAIFQIYNNGDTPFISMILTIKDQTLGAVVFGPDLANSPFTSSPVCPPGGSIILPGETKYVGGDVGFTPIVGDNGRATIVLCTEGNASGDCVEVKVNFTFP